MEILSQQADITKFHGIPWNMVIAHINYIRFPRPSNGLSIEVHGTLESQYQISQSFMQFHGSRMASFQMAQDFMEICRIFNGIRWNYEAVGTLESPYQISQNSMQFHGTRVASYQLTQGFIEFRGVLHGIQCNYEVAKSNITEFQGIRLNFEIVTLIGTMFPWTSI